MTKSGQLFARNVVILSSTRRGGPDVYVKTRRVADLQIYVREQGIFQHDKPDFKPIVDAQVKTCKDDPHAHLLKLDLGSNEKNFKAWAWTDNNGHLSSKAYLELAQRILKIARIGVSTKPNKK